MDTLRAPLVICLVASAVAACGVVSLAPGDAGPPAPIDGATSKRDASTRRDATLGDASIEADLDDAADAEGGSPDTSALADALEAATLDAAFAPIAFTPSNFSVSGISMDGLRPVHVSSATGACVFDTDLSNLTCADNKTYEIIATEVPLASGAGNGVVFAMRSLLVDPMASLSITGTKVAILAVFGPVDIEGSVDTSGSNNNSPGQLTTGPGIGASNTRDSDNNAGGGGGFCGVGGLGSGNAAGGSSYGNGNLIPLVGGSAGGASDGTSSAGGGLQITSAVSILVGAAGGINANGGGGSNDGTAGGGGASGGSILLEAPTVTIDGTLSANGGGGGDGGDDGNVSPFPGVAQATGGGMEGGGGGFGGTIDGQAGQTSGPSNLGGGGGAAGRIRLNTQAGAASMGGEALVSPAASTLCVSQGTLQP